MKIEKVLPNAYLRDDLLTKEDLQVIADRVLKKNELLGDVVCDYDCHKYSLNRYICSDDDLREQFNVFIEESESLYEKEEGDLTEEEFQKILIANEILEINENSRIANEAIKLLDKHTSREVAKMLTISKTKMYDTLKIMGFEKNKVLKQWVHVDNRNLPTNIEGLKRDVEVIDLYTARYGDFDLYNSDLIIKMVDAEIMEDVRALAHELNYETEEDLMNVFLLRGLQTLDYRKVKREGKKENTTKITPEEHIVFLHDGEEGVKKYYKQLLIKEFHYKKQELKHLKINELRTLYYTKKNK